MAEGQPDSEARRRAHADPAGGPVTFLGLAARSGFHVRLVSITGHGELAYEAAEWSGALVVVEEGEIEIECRSATTARFGAGSVLCFDGLGVRAVRNRGGETAVLRAVSRRPASAIAARARDLSANGDGAG